MREIIKSYNSIREVLRAYIVHMCAIFEIVILYILWDIIVS